MPEEEVNSIQDMEIQDAMNFCWLTSFLPAIWQLASNLNIPVIAQHALCMPHYMGLNGLKNRAILLSPHPLWVLNSSVSSFMLSAFSFIALGASFLWAGVSVLLESWSASMTAMTLTQELAYAIPAQFASAAYCAPDGIATWSCRCKANIRKQCLELLEAQRAQKAPRGSGSYESF